MVNTNRLCGSTGSGISRSLNDPAQYFIYLSIEISQVQKHELLNGFPYIEFEPQIANCLFLYLLLTPFKKSSPDNLSRWNKKLKGVNHPSPPWINYILCTYKSKTKKSGLILVSIYLFHIYSNKIIHLSILMSNLMKNNRSVFNKFFCNVHRVKLLINLVYWFS